MEIILKKIPIKRFIDGVKQREQTFILKPNDLLEYGFTESQIKRIAEDWDSNKISRRDSSYRYEASPKY
mgnify:FL=1|jgi:hypothetical protein